MRIAISRHGTTEKVAIERADGSTAQFSIPRKGPISHDLVHFCVESVLGLTQGFWGLVAAGDEPQGLQLRAKAGGHASASRASDPDAQVVELLQAERLVECFEAESWSGTTDDVGLLALATAGWSASHVPPLDLSRENIVAIRRLLRDNGARWRELAESEALILTWGRGIRHG